MCQPRPALDGQLAGIRTCGWVRTFMMATESEQPYSHRYVLVGLGTAAPLALDEDCVWDAQVAGSSSASIASHINIRTRPSSYWGLDITI